MKNSLKKIVTICVVIIAIISIIASVYASRITKNTITKDKNATLGSNDNPFLILEIVPDDAYAEIGYLVGGQEPEDLNTLIDNGSVTADNVQTILESLGGAVRINGVKEANYSIIKEDGWVNYLDENLQTGRETTEHNNIENIVGYFENVGSGEGCWLANYNGESTTEYFAKSWENNSENTYNYVYIDNIGYAEIDINNRTEYYRFDGENYISYSEDTANGVDTTLYDYAYKTFIYEGQNIYAMLNKISSETYRKVDDASTVESFTYVGEGNGDWEFRNAVKSKKFQFNNTSYLWERSGSGQTEYSITWTTIHNNKADMGIGTHLIGTALADVGEEIITEFGFKNSELFKSEVLNLPDSKFESYQIRVITKKINEINNNDIDNANLIYFNNGGNKESYRYKTIVNLYKLIDNKPTDWEPTETTLASLSSEYKSARANEIISRIFSRVALGNTEVTYTNDVVDVNDKDKPVVIFDSSIYDDAILNPEASNYIDYIEKYSLDDTTREVGNLIYKNTDIQYLYDNAFVKLYIIMNEMYPQVYFKHYLEEFTLDEIDLTYLNLTNTYSKTSIINKDNTKISGINQSILLPADIYNKYGLANNYSLMGIDNSTLTAQYLVEHNILSFNSNKDNNLIYSFNKNLIGKTNNTAEVFDTMKYDYENKISLAKALDYLINSQIKNIINKPELSILEIQPSNSFISEKAWTWKVSGLAPYYMGKLSEFNRQTTQMSMRQLIGVNVDLVNDYDLIYIGDDNGAIITSTNTDQYMKQNYSVAIKVGETKNVVPSDFLCVEPKNGTEIVDQDSTTSNNGHIQYNIKNNIISMTGLSEGADTLSITIEMRISDKESVVKSTDIEVYVESKDTKKINLSLADSYKQMVEDLGTYNFTHTASGDSWTRNYGVLNSQYKTYSIGDTITSLTPGNLYVISGVNGDSHSKRDYVLFESYNYNNKALKTRYDKDLSSFKDINGGISTECIWQLEGSEDNYYFRNIGSGDYINLTECGTTTNGVYNAVTLEENLLDTLPLSTYFKDYNNNGWAIYTYIGASGACLNSSGTTKSDYTWNYGYDVTSYPYASDSIYRSWWSIRDVNEITNYGGNSYLSPKRGVSTYNYLIGVQPNTVYALKFDDGISRDISINEFAGINTIEGKTYLYSNYSNSIHSTNQLLNNANNGSNTILFKTSSWCSAITVSVNKDIPNSMTLSKVNGLDDIDFKEFNSQKNNESMLDELTMEYEEVSKSVYEVGTKLKSTNNKELAIGYYVLKNCGNVGSDRNYYLLSKDGAPHLTNSLNTVDDSLDKHYIWYYDGKYFKNLETGQYIIILDNSAYFSSSIPEFETKITYDSANSGWKVAYTPTWSTSCGGNEHTHVPKPTLDPEKNKHTYVNCGWGGWQVEETTTLEWKLECDKDEHKHTEDHKKYKSQSKMKKFWKNNSNKTLGCYTLYRHKEDDEWEYYWSKTCKKDEHTHTKMPDTVPKYKGQTSGCYEAVEITKYDWVNHCTQPEHTHNNECYTHYYLYGTSEENVSGTTDLSKKSAYWDIYKINESTTIERKPCLYITKVFRSTDIASEYKEENKEVNGLTIDYMNYINASKAYDITFELTDTHGNPDYVTEYDNGRFIIKSQYSEKVYKFTLTAKYKTTKNSSEQKTNIYFTIYEIPEPSNSVIDLYQTVYNDENMNGLLYTHIGDWYPIYNRYDSSYSKIYFDGALQKNGKSDLDAGLLSTYNSGDYLVLNARFSGNDLTKHKMDQMQQFLDADLPIIVSDSLVEVSSTGKINSINQNSIDNSSYLYEFLNNNKDKILYSSQTTSNIWDLAFSKSITLTVYSEPRIYNNSDNGGIVEDEDYLEDRKLGFSIGLDTLIKDDTNNYGVKLFIDSNCDGIFSDDEELRNITVQNDSGTTISSEKIIANTGKPYKITKIIPDEYFGVISWKLEFYNTNNTEIHKSISGISALNTKEDERPNIIVLQLKPAYQSSYGYINLDLDSARYKYGDSNDNEVAFYSYMDNLKDFNISVMSSTASRLLNGDNVKDIFAYKVTTKIYSSLDLTENNEIKSTLTPYNSSYLTIIDDSTSGSSYTVNNKPITYTPGTSVLTIEESELTGYNYNDYLGNYIIQPVYGTAEIDGVPVTQTFYVYRFIQGVGFEEIYDYPNGDDHINESEINEVVAIDMIMVGFGDWSYYTDNDNLIDAISNHIRNGKTVLMTHDCMSYHAMEGTSSNSMNDVGDKYRYKLYYALKDLININRYNKDVAWLPKTNREEIADYAEQGWTDSAMVITLQRENRTHAEYVPFYKGNSISKSDKLYNHMTNGNYADNDYNSTRDDSTVLSTLTHAEIVNRGQITEYPYYIPDTIDIALTHHQYWQLDLEDDVAVWLTLRAEAAGYDNFNRDTRNNYYIYSKGNIVYTGMGHSAGITDDEIKLFVNTIVSSYRNSSIGTQLVINDNEASVYGSDTYVYIDSDYSLEDLGHQNLDEMQNQKLKFNIIDNNLITNSKINIEFSAMKPGVNINDVNLKTFDSLTDVVLSTDLGELDNGKIRIYKYTDDINTATLLEANDKGEFTISPEYNYYLSLPEDIIEWAVQKVGSSDSNSFTMYARMTLQYSTRLDSDEEIYTKRIQTLQRIIFIKRGIFMMD